MRPKLAVQFYSTPTGNEPVRVWIKGLRDEVRREIGADILRVQWQWPVSKPLVDGLGGGLYEVRTKVARIQYRVLFCIVDSYMVLLHGFAKKTRTAPDDIKLARERMKEEA